jgi:hypothetical protein
MPRITEPGRKSDLTDRSFAQVSAIVGAPLHPANLGPDRARRTPRLANLGDVRRRTRLRRHAAPRSRAQADAAATCSATVPSLAEVQITSSRAGPTPTIAIGTPTNSAVN